MILYPARPVALGLALVPPLSLEPPKTKTILSMFPFPSDIGIFILFGDLPLYFIFIL